MQRAWFTEWSFASSKFKLLGGTVPVKNVGEGSRSGLGMWGRCQALRGREIPRALIFNRNQTQWFND